MVIEYSSLKDTIDDAYINTATVTATIVDDAGVQVSGQVWPLELDYVTGSNGVYRALLPHDLLTDLTIDYKLITEAITLTGLRRYAEDITRVEQG